MPRVACIGECMIELSEHSDGTLTRAYGGDTLNTALYLARLGIPTDYVTALGDDPFSTAMLAAWQEEGIGTTLIPRIPNRLPGLYLIRTDPAGERQFHYWRDAAPARQLFDQPNPALEHALTHAHTLYLSGITLSLYPAPARARLLALLAHARGHGARVAFDTNYRPRGWPDRDEARRAFAQAFQTSDLVFASTEDHALLHEPATPKAIQAHIAAQGVPEIVVKLDTPAVTVTSGGHQTLIPAPPVPNVLDTTAAGDSFAAAYLAARLRGHSPPDAAQAGHRLAAAVIQHRGAIIPRAAMPPQDTPKDTP